MIRAIGHRHAGHLDRLPFDFVTLTHDERHLRRKRLALPGGGDVMVDLPTATALSDGDALVLEDGRLVGIRAAAEALLEVTPRDADHLLRLCWHLGNRHLPTQSKTHRVLIQRDHVIADMLRGLGATVREVTEPFHPERGAYHSHEDGHGHSHAHAHDHDDAHAHDHAHSHD